MKYSVPQKTSRYDFFLLLSVAVLALNIVSQVAAFPLQCALLIYAVIKSDIRLFPSMFILMLDKSNFKMFEAMAVKINIGFAVSPQNVFLIACFFYCFVGIFKKWYDGNTSSWFIPWLLCIVPALAIALPAKRHGLASMWQQPIVDFLTPALYFWGIGVAKSWEDGKEYFIKRMIVILTFVNALSLFNRFYVFGFANHVLLISLFVGALLLHLGLATCIVGAIGSVFAIGVVLFRHYLELEESQGFAGGAEIGSTFTTVMVAAFCVWFLWLFANRIISKSLIKSIPYIGLAFCSIVFIYAVGRAGSRVEDSALYGNYKNIIERFEFKLVGDRGMVWRGGIEDALEQPLVFKRLERQLQMKYNFLTGGYDIVTKMPPHNQVLTQLSRNGWWLGSFMVLFLWCTHIRAFNSASNMLSDRAFLCVFLAPYAAVFIPVGLTGQSVLNPHFCGNAQVTMIFPGIIYGVWQNRRNMFARKI